MGGIDNDYLTKKSMIESEVFDVINQKFKQFSNLNIPKSGAAILVRDSQLYIFGGE